jgi:hypothetical protein
MRQMSVVTTWRSGVYHLLPICCVYIALRIRFSASECRNFETCLYLLSFLITLLKRTSFPMDELHVFS